MKWRMSSIPLLNQTLISRKLELRKRSFKIIWIHDFFHSMIHSCMIYRERKKLRSRKRLFNVYDCRYIVDVFQNSTCMMQQGLIFCQSCAGCLGHFVYFLLLQNNSPYKLDYLYIIYIYRQCYTHTTSYLSYDSENPGKKTVFL